MYAAAPYHYLVEVEKLFLKDPWFKCSKFRYKEKNIASNKETCKVYRKGATTTITK